MEEFSDCIVPCRECPARDMSRAARRAVTRLAVMAECSDDQRAMLTAYAPMVLEWVGLTQPENVQANKFEDAALAKLAGTCAYETVEEVPHGI